MTENAQLLPVDDNFDENTPTYGYSPARYIQCEPYTDTAINNINANWELGSLHDGYMADVTQGGPAAMVDNGVSAGRLTPGVLERTVHRTEARVILDPEVRIRPGSEWTDQTMRMLGVMGRVSGGTLINGATRDEGYQDVDGYVLMYHHRPLTSLWVYTLARVNAGTPTVLTSLDVNTDPNWSSHPDSVHAPVRLWMEITGTGATVTLDCYRRKMTGQGQGFTDELLFSHADTDASRVVAAGRWGFGVQAAGTDPLGNNHLGLAHEFSIETTDPDPALLYCDLFQRRHAAMGRLLTDDLGATGHSLMTCWVGDHHGPDESGKEHYEQFLTDTAVPNNQAAVGDNLPGSQSFGFYINTRPADGVSSGDTSNQHRAVDARYRNTPSEDREAGIALRFTSLNNNTYGTGGNDADKKCYCAVLLYDGGAATFSAELRRYRGGGPHEVIASAASVTATFNAYTELDFECQNAAPNGGGGARPAMRFKVDGVVVTWTSQVAGVNVFGDWVVDDSGGKIVSGFGEGVFFDGTLSGTPRMFFEDWEQRALSVLDIDDSINEDDMASIFLRSECAGASGELIVPMSWPVQEAPLWYQRRYDTRSGHKVVFSDAGQERRSFRISARGVTALDRQALLDFIETHRAMEVPFNWTLQRTGEVICGRFASPRTVLGLIKGGLEAFSFDIIEAFDGSGGLTPPTASFDNISIGAVGGADYWLRFYDESTAGTVTLTVNLDVAAPEGGVQLAYKLTGDAVQGTHYNITAGASPLVFGVGDTSKTIDVQVLDAANWHKVRSVVVEADPSNSSVAINSLASTCKLLVRPSPDTPPYLEFTTGTSMPSAGTLHTVQVRIPGTSVNTDEPIFPYWRLSGTAVEGTDYDVVSTMGELQVPAGSTTADIKILLETSAAGKTIVIDLDHERETAHGSYTDPNGRQTYHVDENFATYTDDMRYALSNGNNDKPFPGEPADHARGPASCLKKTPDPVSHVFDPIKRHPKFGTPLNVLYATPGTPCDGYWRKDFEKGDGVGGTVDGPTQAFEWEDYVRFSIKVELPSLIAPVTGYTRYIRVSLFDRGTGDAYAVQFDRESTDPSRVSHSTGEWFAAVATNSDWTKGGGGSVFGTDFGVDVNPDGEAVLWILVNQILTVGAQGYNRIIYPVNDGAGQNSGNWSGRGMGFLDPRVETSTSPLTGPPPDDYFPKLRDFWEPLGSCTLETGGTHQHTVSPV